MTDEEILKEPRVMIENSIAKEWEKIAYDRGIRDGEQSERKRILELIDEFSNPYPKDIFLWDNKEKLDFNRGRFNQHCFEIVENIREALKKQVEK